MEVQVPDSIPPNAEEPTHLPIASNLPCANVPEATVSAGGCAEMHGDTGRLDQALRACLAPPQSPGEIGRLGEYRVLKVLGAGGMGVVFQAEDPKLHRHVAIKTMLPSAAVSATARQRFLREAQAVAAIEHDHIVPIFQVGEDRGVPFIAMPFLKGEPLDARLKRDKTLPVAEILRIGRQTAKGLQAAHAAGVVHRDIKPANIWLEREGGRVKILDFGLARAAADNTQLTQQGTFVGTPAYMAPEQASGKAVDGRCDLFSLGCVLYHLSTGRPPFMGCDPLSTLVSVTVDEPESPISVKPELPPELSDLVMRLLAKRPEDRLPSAEAVEEALERIEKLTVTQAGELHKASPTLSPAPHAEQRAIQVAIAVLPFEFFGSDKEHEYFGEGLAEELIGTLSKIKGMRVASRASCFAFKGPERDLSKIAEQLKVSAVLEGSVRRAGNRLRISAQLVDVADGYQRWSAKYDRDIENVFAIQDEIARNIAHSLEVVLSENERKAIARVPTGNVQAYEYYLRGRQFFHQFSRDGFEQARKLYLRACELDPGYAAAYAGVAECCCLLYRYCDANESYLRQADEASRTALTLDPQLSEAQLARGLLLSFEHRFEDARRGFESAIHQKPESFDAYYFYARLCFAEGRFDQAALLLKQASRINPCAYEAPLLQACVCDALGQTIDAQAANRQGLRAAEDYLELFPDDGRALCLGALAAVRLGLVERGLQWAKRALELHPKDPIVLHYSACALARLGHSDAAIDRLEQAVGQGMRHREWLENDTDLRALRQHPRFQALLERLKPPSAPSKPEQICPV
jgi:non-specific serine/threonine protein kinase